MMQKGFTAILILVGILVIVGIAGGAYYFFQKSPKYGMGFIPTPPEIIEQVRTATPSSFPNETANWKTYTNTKLGYSFKHPSEWVNCFGGGETDTMIYLCSASTYPFDYIWTSFMDNPHNLTFQEIATQDLPDGIKNNFKYTTVTMGKNLLYITRSLPARKESEHVFFKTSNNGYIGIAYQPNNGASGFTATYSSYKIFNQILSTFKFLDQNTNSCPVGFKLYDGEAFSICYPEDASEKTDKFMGRNNKSTIQVEFANDTDVIVVASNDESISEQNRCLISEDITIGTLSAQRYQQKRTTNNTCGAVYQIFTLLSKNGLTYRIIDTKRKFLTDNFTDLSLYRIMEQSFRIKNP